MKLKMLFIFFYIFLPIHSKIVTQEDQSVIAFEPSYLSITIGESHSVNVRLLIPDLIPPDISIQFLYNNKSNDPQGYITDIPNITFTKQTGDDQTRVIIINGHHQGHLVVTTKSPQVNISSIYDFLLIDIARSRVLNVFIQLVGWVYFVAWSISFYPQIILNFRRQSVVGLNFDFLALNLLGHSCYSVFNIYLYTSHEVQQEYYVKHPHGILPVLLNDVSEAPNRLINLFRSFFRLGFI
jgi:cystinosin